MRKDEDGRAGGWKSRRVEDDVRSRLDGGKVMHSSIDY